MDIATLTPSEITIDILHPATDAKTGIRVSIVSATDERMKKIRRAIVDKKMKLDQRNKNFDFDDIEHNRNSLCVKAMTGWDWGTDENGEPNMFNGEVPAFNEPNILKVFKELPWFRNQIEEAISDEKAFFQN